jgi:protein gp37
MNFNKFNPIGWCHFTINHWWGCTKVSPGCLNCYAEGLDSRFHGGEHWGKGSPRKPRLEAARKEALALNHKAQKDGTRYRVFANSMNDWLDPEVPIEWLAFMLETIRCTPNLDWLLLTKRPELWRERMQAVNRHLYYSTEKSQSACDTYNWLANWEMADNGPENVWIGTSVEDQTRANERHKHLMNIPARVLFWSGEPLLSEIQTADLWEKYGAPDWVIVGGESGRNARPMHPDWARSLRDQCEAADVPFLFKQWGEWLPFDANSPCLRWKNENHDGGSAAYLDEAHVDGRVYNVDKIMCDPDSNAVFVKVGKERAGRQLLGRVHNEFPETN